MLEQELSGTLFSNDMLALSQPMVIENYLRLVTAYAALSMGGVLFHSAGVVVDGRAYLFVGRSGAGKSTLARLALATGTDILSDDNNLL